MRGGEGGVIVTSATIRGYEFEMELGNMKEGLSGNDVSMVFMYMPDFTKIVHFDEDYIA